MTNAEQFPHLFVTGRSKSESYVYAGPIPRGTVRLPARDSATHGTTLREELDRARQENELLRGVTTSPEAPARIILEVESEPDFELALDSLEPRGQGVELACVRQENGVRTAVIHVPEEKLGYFVKRVEQYLGEQTAKGQPKNQNLFDRIAAIRLASLRSFWTDEGSSFPALDQAIWWETWLRAEGDQDPWVTFQMIAEAAGLRMGRETIRFPDRLVVLCFGTAAELSSTVDLLDLLGEVRRAKENPAEFVEMSPREQGEWVNHLRGRLVPPGHDAPAVCILDGGVVLHPLVRPALSPEDAVKYDPTWPLTDGLSHGTEMAGIAIYGDQLPQLLQDVGPVYLRHRLESVKILPPPPRGNDPKLYGAITAQSAYRIESQAPTRPRAFCMAVTTDGRDRGLPSSWSGEVDQLCAGVRDGHRRLFFISAGNVKRDDQAGYPEVNDTDTVHDPGQALNAVTVGAYTELVQFPHETYPGCRPVARAGDLSPSSTTSLTYYPEWPYKPDVVLEGGNAIVDPATGLIDTPEQMSLLTTAHATGGRLLVGFGDTSAATAQGARIAALIWAEYPKLWPETVRALMIHSAEWTLAMQRAFDDPALGLPEKRKCLNRLRRYGYGVPSLPRALYSARNALTLIAEESLQPFDFVEGDVKTKDMRVHSLPWPVQELHGLGERPVTMRVTLSYFIEPKPGRRGNFPRTRHRYQSHGLRFEVKRPVESLDEFRQRVSKAAREDEEEYTGAVGDAGGWTLGPKLRTRGSLHSDWWKGTASDLAACGSLAVFPVTGWWRERTDQEHWSKHARYALIVSIDTPEQSVDLYTPVLNLIRTEIQT
jgi:Subtilase family